MTYDFFDGIFERAFRRGLRDSAFIGAFPGEGINVPQVIDLVPIQFVRPGQVDVQVSIDEEPAGDLSFWLLPAAPT